MGVVRVSATKCVRRPLPKRWAPEFLKVLVPEYDGERADPTQLDLFRRQREAIERVRL